MTIREQIDEALDTKTQLASMLLRASADGSDTAATRSLVEAMRALDSLLADLCAKVGVSDGDPR